MKRALALALLLATRAAHAQGAYVDVQDLPPLPPASEEESSSATLLAASQVEEDVVVGAAKREQSLGNVASAVTVVSGDRLRRFGYRTVGEAVAGVAGVYISDNRISYSVGIRGMQVPGDFNTRILVLVDGASVNEGWGSFAGLSFDNFVSIDDVARIEVIRGPVSSLYGSNAFFGIVNIVTRSAAETPRAWAKASINSIWGVTTSAGFATGDVHQQLRGTFQQMNRLGDTSSVPDVGSGLEGDASHQYMLSLVGSYQGSFAQVRAVQYRRDSPFAPYNGDPADPDPYNQYDKQLLVEGGHTRELSKRFTLAGRGYANLYRFTDHINQINGIPFDDLGEAKTFGAEVRGRYELVMPNKLGVTAGTEANYNVTRSVAQQLDGTSEPAEVPLDFAVVGVYTELDGQPTDWLGYTAGLRFDQNTKIDRSLSPRAALFLSTHEKYGLKLLYAQGFRNPSAFEGFFTDQTSFAANPDIGSERIYSGEVVAWAKPVAGLSTRLSGFYWDARDVVEQLPFTDPVTGMDQLQFQNADRFVTRGVEVEASYRNAAGWYSFGGLSYQQVGAESETAPLTFGEVPNAPAIIGSVGVSTPKLGNYVHLSSEAIFVGERPTRPDVDTGDALDPAPAWVGWNGSVYVPDLRGFDLTAGVRNIIGKRQRIVAPGDYDRYDETTMSTTTIPLVPGEGREIYVKVGYRY
ncbi:MAG TPA: TonB-dependent receptor [Kofleriaceae bacterium]|nr:TonB-dependent receptor [Kofleriaceae bacterium]